MKYFTAESVAPGHPDKIADQISDAILDAYLAQDPLSRVAVETSIKDRQLFILGEVTSKAENVDPAAIARDVLVSIGHGDDRWWMAAEQMNITVHLSQQSINIAAGVDSTEEIGAGDQGMMYGYATDESESYLPLALHYAHSLLLQYNFLRCEQLPEALGPDAKSQVTVAYNEDGTVSHIDTVVISAQHDGGLGLDALRNLIENSVIRAIIPAELITDQTRFLINPAGDFVLGGSAADAGLTGRKIIVDSYGGAAPHGGGAFSGKDPTKVDRSAAYAARHLAKEIVRRGLAKRATVRLAYAIGQAEPLELSVDTHGTGTVDAAAVDALKPHFTPRAIIERLQLRQPIYLPSATFGHFGRMAFPWEQPWTEIAL